MATVSIGTDDDGHLRVAMDDDSMTASQIAPLVQSIWLTLLGPDELSDGCSCRTCKDHRP